MDFFFAVLISVCISSTFCAKFPTNVKRCQFKDPNFQKCNQKAVEDTIRKLTKPNKELGLPSLEPLVVPSLTIGAGTGAVNLVQHYDDFKIYGYTNITIDHMHWDFDKNHVTVDVHFNDKLIFDAHYNIKGKVLLLPVYGSGRCRIELENVKGHTEYQLQMYEKNGKKHNRAISETMKIEPSKMRFNFENLFNGDKLLGDNINKVLNDNWREIFDDIHLGYEQALSKIDLALFNSVFSKFSLDEVYGDF